MLMWPTNIFLLFIHNHNIVFKEKRYYFCSSSFYELCKLLFVIIIFIFLHKIVINMTFNEQMWD